MNYTRFLTKSDKQLSRSDQLQIIGLLETVISSEDADYIEREMKGPPADDPSGWVEYTADPKHRCSRPGPFFRNWLT